MAPILPWVILVIILGWLQIYFFWVESGTFVLKKKIRSKWLKIWKIENNYAILNPGRHYLFPFFDSIVTDSSKKVFLIPTEKKNYSIDSLQCISSENISFTLSISFEFCVKDTEKFLKYISSTNVDVLEKNIDVLLKKIISDITTKECKKIEVKNTFYKDIKKNIIKNISLACSNQAKFTYIEITDVDINLFHLSIDPQDDNIMNYLLQSHAKNSKPDQYKDQLIKFIKDVNEQPLVNNGDSIHHYNITFQLPKNFFV